MLAGVLNGIEGGGKENEANETSKQKRSLSSIEGGDERGRKERK